MARCQPKEKGQQLEVLTLSEAIMHYSRLCRVVYLKVKMIKAESNGHATFNRKRQKRLKNEKKIYVNVMNPCSSCSHRHKKTKNCSWIDNMPITRHPCREVAVFNRCDAVKEKHFMAQFKRQKENWVLREAPWRHTTCTRCHRHKAEQ